ncbi:MAG: hypothetical protein IPI55_16235 [Flavobacteriales bacterium]|jgi:hypothetical protein|nr:hypothetical protein [Flavobacteriales bacterium]
MTPENVSGLPEELDEEDEDDVPAALLLSTPEEETITELPCALDARTEEDPPTLLAAEDPVALEA